jgi:hypothetical protein
MVNMNEMFNSKYKKYNYFLGVIMFIYPLIKFSFDIILNLAGQMIFIIIVVAIGIVGLIIGIIQKNDEYKLSSIKVFRLLIVLFIVEIILSVPRIIHIL